MTAAAPVGRVTLSAFFGAPAEVDEAVYRLELLGVPRDLVQVAATSDTAKRLYPRGGVRFGRRAGRMAGAGALVGLLVGIAISLALLLVPTDLPDTLALVQLLGPNFSTTVGAVVGAIYGLFAPPPALGVYERLRERSDALLLVVRSLPATAADEAREALASSGGADIALAPPV